MKSIPVITVDNVREVLVRIEPVYVQKDSRETAVKLVNIQIDIQIELIIY